MNRNRHHSSAALPFLVENIELVNDGLHEIGAAVAFAKEKRNVVDLHRIRNRYQLSRLDLHRIGLVIVTPVAQITNPLLGQ
jgi:hypothetical protein